MPSDMMMQKDMHHDEEGLSSSSSVLGMTLNSSVVSWVRR